jgi:spore maturation protein CgeB
LPGVYRQAAIVIDDANHVTKAWGAANSRVFDALAAGCLVITNSESVSVEVFNGELPVYRSNDDLVQLVSHYANDHASRTRLQERLRSVVLAKHCYAHRAFEFGLHFGRNLTTKS